MTRSLWIKNTNYPITIEGTGSIDCLCIGLGNLLMRTLSPRLKEIFTLYASDLYFVNDPLDTKLCTITMEILVADICETISQLNLDQPMIMAHSCFGIVALEVAKKLPTLKGVILVACAPEWNSQSLAFTEKYYQTHAERARLANDKKRKALYLLTKKPTDSELSIEKYIADSARYWGNFEVTDEEILALWRGIKVNDWVANQFYETILPSHDLKKEIETIEAPVLLLAGERDYDSIPLVQWANYPHPSNFTIINCGPVGHWPQLENTLLFDNSVKNWIKST